MYLMMMILVLSFSALSHEEKLEKIDIIEQEDSEGLVDFTPSVKRLKGQELNKRRQTSVGDTLSQEAGIQSTNFGPNASRPVIRGLEGERVRILQNSLGTMDASTQSVDHAIPVDVMTIDSVELLRGPMSLLYGTSVVGGVVNIVTNRIHSDYEEGFFSKLRTQGETVNNGVSSSAHLNYGANKWMFHVDGSTRNLGDVNVPGHARTSDERQAEPDASERKGKMRNSLNKQDNVAVGASKILDRGYFGVSYNHFNSLYGTVAEKDVKIDMTQNRFEFHGEYRPESSAFRKVKIRSAQSDYFHKELEGGETGTTFKNRGNETRIEGVTKSGNWDGVTGIQTQTFSFSAKGDEAFLPSSKNKRAALFSFQQYTMGKQALRFSGRVENFDIDKVASDTFGASASRNFVGLNGSIGHCYDFSKTNTLETSYSYTERAPSAQELFSNGEHVATGTFEVGNTGLRKEKAHAVEVTYKNHTERNQFMTSVYTQKFDDYIALIPTGTQVGGVDEYNYEQVGAIFYGLDIDNRYELKKTEKGVLYLLNKFDFVRAKNTSDGDNLPRISPPRALAGIEYVSDVWRADVETQYVAHQTKIASEESRTNAFWMTNIGYSYNILRNVSSLELFARVRNILNVEARSHISTLKQVAPLPGRNFIAGVQYQF